MRLRGFLPIFAEIGIDGLAGDTVFAPQLGDILPSTYPRQNLRPLVACKARLATLVDTSFLGKGKDEKDEDDKRKAGYRMPRTVTVFHVSQTEQEVEA